MAEELKGPSFFSYNLTVETPIDIDDLIYTLSPNEYPLLLGMGGDGVPMLSRQPASNTEFYWMEEEVPLPRGLIAEALDTSETDVTVATGDAVKFRVGDGVRIDDEIMIVTDIDTSTEVLTVARGSASLTNTTAANHADGSEIIGIGTILIEGAIGSANFQGRDKYYNYMQIFSGKINVSRTEQAIRKYGVPSELLRQTHNNMLSLNLGLEQAMMYGVRHKVTATNRRQMGGLDYYITTNNDTSSTWLTIASIDTQLQNIFNNGGSFDDDGYVLIANPAAFAALNNGTAEALLSNISVDDARRGRQYATSVRTNFGMVQLARSRWVAKTDAFLVKKSNLALKQLRPMQTEKLAKTDDTDSFMTVCEVGLKVKGEAHMAKFSALDQGSAQPGSGLM